MAAAVTLLAPASVPAPAQAARPASCPRHGYKIVSRSGHVRVLQRHYRIAHGLIRTRSVACWAPTRRRTFVANADVDRESGVGREIDVAIVDGRFLGVTSIAQVPAGSSISAEYVDARTGRKLHDTAACSRGQLQGPHFVGLVFLPDSRLHRGGMAFACNEASSRSGYRVRVFLFRDWRASTPETVEDRSSASPLVVDGIEVETAGGFATALSWTLVAGGAPPETRSVPLP